MGGGAVGALFTPAPWRLTTDAALWSENWPGIPRPARGEVTERYTNCALCPAGCAVRARLVNGQPVSLAGVAAHPLSHGALCAWGVAGHHLPYDPRRLKQGSASESEAAAAVADAMAKRATGERVALLDLLPGRAASTVYRRAMAAVKDGAYLAAPRAMGGAAVDLAKTRTVLSLGAPVLAGWGTPGNVFRARANFRLIQAEPYESATAALADEWLAIQPGSEGALARSLTAALKRKAAPAEDVAATGLSGKQVADLAAELAANGPALVLSAEDSAEVLELNEALGAFGKTIAMREEKGEPAAAFSLASVPDGSIRVLLVDESVPGGHIPWAAMAKKLVARNAVVVAFAWSREGYGRHAQFVLPAAVYPETTTDIPAAIDSPAPVFRLATPLMAAPAGITDPVVFVAKAAGIDAGNPLRERADAIHKAGKGVVFTPADGKTAAVKDLKPDDFWKALNEGATWIGEAGATAASRAAKPESVKPEAAPQNPPVAAFPLVVAFTARSAATLASPLISKLYQDSDLRLRPDTAAIHPDTARAAGVEGASQARMETEYGACSIGLVADAAVPPGMLELAPGPETLDICGTPARAKVVAL